MSSYTTDSGETLLLQQISLGRPFISARLPCTAHAREIRRQHRIHAIVVPYLAPLCGQITGMCSRLFAVPPIKSNPTTLSVQLSVGGIMVSIVAFQAIDPGSIPGQRIFFSVIVLVCLS